MFSDYPKSFTLKNGIEAVIRPIEKRDKKKLHEFFQRLPQRDRMYLKEDVTDIAVIDRWFKELDYKRVIPLVVLIDNEIVADGTLHIDQYGWARHVGEIRLVVDKRYRKIGVAVTLITELYFLAMHLKLEKLVAKVMINQKRVQQLLSDIGFKREATLKNHVMDRHGKKHSLVFMTHEVDAHWKELEDFYQDHYDDFSGDFSGA